MTAPSAAHAPEPSALVVRDDRGGGVTWLTLNRPTARNSLSSEMMSALEQALAEAREDPAVRVVVLAGSGPGFCAGHDLKEVQAHRNDPDRGAAFFRDLFDQCSRMMQAVVRLPKPVVARVHGVATAAGCQLVASCDLAVASQDARFATPGVNIGLFCSTPMVALSRAVHTKHAMEMLLTGEMIDAGRAAEIGLVNRAVPAERLDEEVEGLARRIAAKSAHTLKLGKETFYRQKETDLASAYAYTGEVMVRNLLADDAEEGICAFLDKRQPVWRDR